VRKTPRPSRKVLSRTVRSMHFRKERGLKASLPRSGEQRPPIEAGSTGHGSRARAGLPVHLTIIAKVLKEF